MSDIFLNGELKGVCSPELAEAVGLCVEQYEKRIAELQATIEKQRELMEAVAESDADVRRQQATHWCNPTIDIMAQHLKETGS